MLHKCDEDYEALAPNFEELDKLFPGSRKRLEDYDPWKTNSEEELLLLPYLFHLHTHSEEVGNFTKGLPKETSESISEKTMIKLSGNIFRKSALMHVMEGDG
eukprot:6999807-Heterocapsa_arctica.AAC.1